VKEARQENFEEKRISSDQSLAGWTPDDIRQGVQDCSMGFNELAKASSADSRLPASQPSMLVDAFVTPIAKRALAEYLPVEGERSPDLGNAADTVSSGAQPPKPPGVPGSGSGQQTDGASASAKKRKLVDVVVDRGAVADKQLGEICREEGKLWKVLMLAATELCRAKALMLKQPTEGHPPDDTLFDTLKCRFDLCLEFFGRQITMKKTDDGTDVEDYSFSVDSTTIGEIVNSKELMDKWNTEHSSEPQFANEVLFAAHSLRDKMSKVAFLPIKNISEMPTSAM
jgi:hypothetical protein